MASRVVVVPFGLFGSVDKELYERYLDVCGVASVVGGETRGVRSEGDLRAARGWVDGTARQLLDLGVRGECVGGSAEGAANGQWSWRTGDVGERSGSGEGAVRGFDESSGSREQSDGVGGDGAGRCDAQARRQGRNHVACGMGVKMPRGPNYERNRLARERKKEAKRVRLAGDAELDELERSVRRVTLEHRFEAMNRRVGRSRAVEQLADAKLSRALVEEKQKEARTAAGMDHVAEALRLVRDAVAAAELAKYQPVAAVAGWVATVASSGAESVAKTASTGVSLKSVSSATSASGFAAAKGPLNVVEGLLVEYEVTTEKIIRSARAKVGRPLGLDDVFRSDAPFRMSSDVKREVALAGAGLPREGQPFYG